MTCPPSTATWKRTAVESHLLDTVTLRNPGAESRGAGGGVVAGTAVDTTGVAARLQQSGFSGDVRAVAERLQLLNPCVWYFSYTQSGITEKTTLIIFGARQFKVQAVNKGGAFGVLQEAICEEIR